jgi:hypothetical protein
MKPPLILPKDSRLLPLSRAGVDVAQTHRFPEFLQASWQTACQADLKEMQATVAVDLVFSIFISRMLLGFW